MKKIIEPQQEETAVYYSDFSGKILNNVFGPPAILEINFNYGSKNDGEKITLHLDDDDIDKILKFLNENLNEKIQLIK
jgi:hypothetical protein